MDRGPIQLDPYAVQGWMRQWRRQSRVAEAWARHQSELDAREDECWRMFGVTVTYVMDERVILTDTQIKGMDSTMGAL